MVKVIVGDCAKVLSDMKPESVHCIIVSPPYWGLRQYGSDEGMIGLEPTWHDHLANMRKVFRHAHRVLRSDGTVWLNYGDAYAGGGRGGDYGNSPKQASNKGSNIGRFAPEGFKPKDLMMLPARLAMALQADGWWLRSEIIWHKPNPMPESVTDRPTSAHEKMYLFSKSQRYFYDMNAVRVPGSPHTKPRRKDGQFAPPKGTDPNDSRQGTWQYTRTPEEQAAIGINVRNVWTIPTTGYSDAHFATFPPKLVEPCIKAGTSEHGCCDACGAPWTRIIENPRVPSSLRNRGADTKMAFHTRSVGGGQAIQSWRDANPPQTIGWKPPCKCGAAVVPCTVLDPFAGAGTTGLVADRLGRDAVLIEINPDYAKMAEERIAGDAPMFTDVKFTTWR